MLVLWCFTVYDIIKQSYVAAGSAVVSPPRQSIEGLFTLHTHCHFIVSDPAGGALPQLCTLYANKTAHTQGHAADRV